MKNKPYPLYSLSQVQDLKEMVKKRAEHTPDETAFLYSSGKNSIKKKTCQEFNDDIDAVGTFLYEKGYVSSHIAIIGENSYEWLVTFFAIANGGNVAVPIDRELSSGNVEKLLVKTDCEAVFISKNYEDLVDENNGVAIFLLSEVQSYVTYGKRLIEGGQTSYLHYSVNCDQLAAIFFTSGTTGGRKGVMLSQKNIVSDINYACKNFRLDGDTLAVLPFHHTFGLITAVCMVFHYGHSTYINKSLRYIQRDLQIVKPQTMFMVPMFVETFYKRIIEAAKKTGRYHTLLRTAKISSFLLRIGIDMRKRLFQPVHEAFGGNLEYIICGGAPLNTEYVKIFRSWGITILNGYGITECAPVVSVNRNGYWRDGSVGQILDGCLVRIADDNEILVKGSNVMMGYYQEDAATMEVLIDGWYHTGDLGHIDEQGFLYVTGRKKNLIILSNGENVSPEEIEAELLTDKAVEEVVVYGEDGLLTAEIFPVEEYLGNQEYFNNLINRRNSSQPQYRRIHQFRLRDKEFEKNSTKKILRDKAGKDYV